MFIHKCKVIIVKRKHKHKPFIWLPPFNKGPESIQYHTINSNFSWSVFMGVKEGVGVPNPAYHFIRLLFRIHILHNKIKSHLKSSIPHIISKPSNPTSQKIQWQNPAYQKKWKTNPAFSFFILAPKCWVISPPQLFTDYKEAKGIHLSPFWKCCLAKGNPFIFHSNPAFKSGKVAILHTS